MSGVSRYLSPSSQGILLPLVFGTANRIKTIRYLPTLRALIQVLSMDVPWWPASRRELLPMLGGFGGVCMYTPSRSLPPRYLPDY